MGTYPLRIYHFKVEWGGIKTGFTEVSGLPIENELILYRKGGAPEYNVIKTPDLRKFSNITLKRGITKGNKNFFDWINTIQHNTVERREVTVCLLEKTMNRFVYGVFKMHGPAKWYGLHGKQTAMK